jgi:hypothetical protein
LRHPALFASLHIFLGIADHHEEGKSILYSGTAANSIPG